MLRFDRSLSRREFLYLSSLAAASVAVGCATNPVTGKQQLMLVSEQQEIAMDQQHSPHQLSADYGATQDGSLNRYVDGIGQRMGDESHRPKMPYSFRVVNANYVNAYAFPGGTIAATRGIMLELDNEAELAALLGHELGHVNARHTAEIMSKQMLTSAVVGGVAVYAGTKSAGLGGLAAQLGMLSSGVLLASYSRDNERQADDLGMNYLVKSDYSPEGMVGLMDMLKGLSKGKHSSVELLFATHPMSTERYDTAVATARNKYGGVKGNPDHRDRYMDNIAGLRRIEGAIKSMQKAEAALAKKKYEDANQLLGKALKIAPNDYVGLMLMAKSSLAQQKLDDAETYLDKAEKVYPEEAQAHFLGGYTKIKKKKFDAAIAHLEKHDKLLPGNITTAFFKGYAYEGKGDRKQAADNYYTYLKAVNQGDNAQYAYDRLVRWGYIKQKQ
jgi:predicted Zn-dependent protease